MGAAVWTSPIYTRTRARGLAPWRPQGRTRILMDQVAAVLEEYADHLPMTGRQIFYRLVGAYGYEKTERASKRLLDHLVRARRAGVVPFNAIRDDGVTVELARGFHDLADFWGAVQSAADSYRRDRQAGQAVYVEAWVEAGGMVPQVARVAHEYGIPVYSCGGFDSLSAKHEAALRVLHRDRNTVILHAGDHDPSGLALYRAAADDVAQLAADMGSEHEVTCRRVAVTPEQIERYALPTAPAKETDNRGGWTGGTVQAEALAPADLASEVRASIEAVIDIDIWARVIDIETAERESLAHMLERGLPGGA